MLVSFVLCLELIWAMDALVILESLVPLEMILHIRELGRMVVANATLQHLLVPLRLLVQDVFHYIRVLFAYFFGLLTQAKDMRQVLHIFANSNIRTFD